MSELITAAKAVIEDLDNPRVFNVRDVTEQQLRSAVERAEKQESIRFDEWWRKQDMYHCSKAFAITIWTAAQQAERDRIRARVKLAAEKTWRAGDWYIGPRHGDIERLVEALLEDGDATT